MTSARKIRANRVNAQASTGPRTEYGRARAAQNARRYGLSLPIAVLPALSQQAEMLAQEIARGSTDQELLQLARRVAEAQFDQVRIRQARQHLLVENMQDAKLAGASRLADQLIALDRYERRAFSRRKFAIREFCASWPN